MKTYLQVIGKVNYILFLLFLFSATFASELFRFFGTAWFISWALEFRFLKRSNFRADKFVIPLILFALLWIYQAISLLWCSNVAYGLATLNKQVYLIAFLFVALFGVNSRYKVNTCLTSLIIGSVVSSIMYFFVMFYVANGEHYFAHPYDKFDIIFPFTEYAAYSSFLKHRLYHCTLLLIALISTGYLYRYWKKVYGQANTIIMVVGITFILFSTIILTGSRASLLAIFLISIAYLVFRFWKYRFLTLSIVAVFFILGAITIIYHPRMNITLEDIENLNDEDAEVRSNSEPRLQIWNLALRNYDDYLLFGKGVGQSRNYMVSLYEKEDLPPIFLERRYNAHNQYLETTIELGIPGLIILLCALLSLWYVSERRTRVFVAYYLLLILSNLLTESMLGRSDGILTIGLMTFIFILMNREEIEVDKIKEQEKLVQTPTSITSEQA